jgi:hypothetical protein
MLRMRPKPPAGLPTINAGTPWLAMDMADLEEFLTNDTSVKEIASYLCREVDEVEAKIVSLRGTKVLRLRGDRAMGAERIAQLRRELEQSERQIVEGVTNIAKQLKLIADLERLGHDRAAPESLLALFEEIQRMHQQHRQAIIRELDELDPPLPLQRTGGASG